MTDLPLCRCGHDRSDHWSSADPVPMCTFCECSRYAPASDDYKCDHDWYVYFSGGLPSHRFCLICCQEAPLEGVLEERQRCSAYVETVRDVMLNLATGLPVTMGCSATPRTEPADAYTTGRADAYCHAAREMQEIMERISSGSLPYPGWTPREATSEDDPIHDSEYLDRHPEIRGEMEDDGVKGGDS